MPGLKICQLAWILTWNFLATQTPDKLSYSQKIDACMTCLSEKNLYVVMVTNTVVLIVVWNAA